MSLVHFVVVYSGVTVGGAVSKAVSRDHLSFAVASIVARRGVPVSVLRIIELELLYRLTRFSGECSEL